MKPAFRAHPWHVCTLRRAPDPCPQQLDARALGRIPALAHVLRRTEFCSPGASLGERLEWSWPVRLDIPWPMTSRAAMPQGPAY